MVILLYCKCEKGLSSAVILITGTAGAGYGSRPQRKMGRRGGANFSDYKTLVGVSYKKYQKNSKEQVNSRQVKPGYGILLQGDCPLRAGYKRGWKSQRC